MKKLFSAFAALILFLTAAPAFSETGSFQPAADRALDALTSALNAQKQRIYVYREFGDTENHYTAASAARRSRGPATGADGFS